MKEITMFLFPMLFVSISACMNNVNESDTHSDSQFVQIYFKYAFKNELDTFDKTYQKDLIFDGEIKVYFWLTTEEQNKILQKVNEIRFFDLPEYFPRVSNIQVMPDAGEQVLRIKYLQHDKTIIWFSFPLDEDNLELNQLKELASFIQEIIENKPEYKKLPPSNGGYL